MDSHLHVCSVWRECVDSHGCVLSILGGMCKLPFTCMCSKLGY